MKAPLERTANWKIFRLGRWVVFCFLLNGFLPNLSYGQVTNQHLYDTMPNMPGHYRERVEKFKREDRTKGKIVFLGNSITEGGEWHGLTDGVETINRGIGGDVTYGVLSRLDEITSLQPAKLFIMIGINDIGKDFPSAVILSNYRKIIQRVRSSSPSTQIFIQSILPVNPSVDQFPQHYDKGSYIIVVNNLLTELARSQKIKFIDLYSSFADEHSQLRIDLTYDGLHLNKAGYQLWISHLRQNGYL